MENAVVLTQLFQEELYSFRSPLVVVLARDLNTYSEGDHVVLKRLLSAVGVGSDAATILVRPEVSLEELKTFAPARVLVFGSEIPAGIPAYQETTTHGFSVIRADDLPLDEAKKKQLWTGLKAMFDVR